jgi:hypothetical protein
MKGFNRRELLGLCLLVMGLFLVGHEVWAQAPTGTPGTSSGQTSQLLANQLYCDARGLITGNLGLILGLLLVFSGLWGLVTGGGWFGAILSIIIGAAVPSIPGLVEGFLMGMGNLLIQAQMTQRNFTPPTCPAPKIVITPEQAAAMACTGGIDCL